MFKQWYQIGQYLRNPSIPKWLAFLKDSEHWSLEELEAYQLLKLREITQQAYQHSPFYRLYFDQQGFHPDQLVQLSDVKKIPILSKQQLLEQVEKIHTNIKNQRTYTATTSGSSGDSLQFRRDEAADSFNRAAILRGYSWYGVQPWEYSGYFWGFNFTWWGMLKTSFLDFLQHRFRIFSYEEKAFKTFVRKLQKASYITGYSSMIYEAAKIINEQKLTKPQKLKLVVGTSEKIHEVYQEEVRKAFGTKLVSEYGATEAGIIAFECPEGNMHINMEGVLVEEINNEVLVTNLQMQSFPVIRYRLGDYIRLAPKDFTCPCGMQHRMIEEITGRIGQTIYGKEGKYPTLYSYYIFKNLSNQYGLNLNYLAEQKVKGELLLHLEQEITQEQSEHIQKECRNYFKEDMEVTILEKSLKRDPAKKATSFKSHIKP